MAKQKLHLDNALDGGLWQHHAKPGQNTGTTPARQMHRHQEPEFNLVTQGKASYLVDGQRYDIRANTLLWLLPKQNHVLVDESADFAMWIAVFRPAMLKLWVKRGGPKEILAGKVKGVPCHLLAQAIADDLLNITHRTASMADEPVMFNASLPLLALHAWRILQQADKPQIGQAVHPAVERAALIIRQNPADAVLQDIADFAGLSLSHLSRLFKLQTGVALVTYRQQQRLRLFQNIYNHQGRHQNMTHAALAAGFGSYPQFHRIFKITHGQGPQRFYKQNKNHSST